MSEISVCIIAKNEEQNIGGCLSAISKIASEIVVVDTGSSDGTIGIAKSCGAKVMEIEWRDDFSFAKNFAIAQATKPWILSLDADEIIAERDFPALLQLISDDRPKMVSLIQTSYSFQRNSLHWQPRSISDKEAIAYPGYIESRLIRLFPRSPKIGFFGRIHEYVRSSDSSVSEFVSDIRIHHYGFIQSEARMEHKKMEYARIAVKRMDEQPNDYRVVHEAGVQLWEIGRIDEAYAAFMRAENISAGRISNLFALGSLSHRRKDYAKALDYYRRIIDVDRNHILSMLGAAEVLKDMGRLQDVEEVLLRAQQIDEKHPIVQRKIGALYLGTGFYKLAIEHLNRAIPYMEDDCDALFDIGCAYIKSGERSEGVKFLRMGFDLANRSTSFLERINEIAGDDLELLGELRISQ